MSNQLRDRMNWEGKYRDTSQWIPQSEQGAVCSELYWMVD